MLYSVSETPFEQKWDALSKFLNEWYEKPDLNSLKIVLCTYIAHFELSDPPIYLFVNGAPGTGKTEIAIRAIEWLPHTNSISELSSNSFLSGFGEKTGILDNLKSGHGVLTFPDFNNTILTQDPIKRNELVGQFRRIYDGKFSKKVGNKAKILEWKGKASMIAAVTPNIEDYWALTRDLGERWLTVQWTSPESHDDEALRLYANKAMNQIENKKSIHAQYKKLITSIMSDIGNGVKLENNNKYRDIITSLALIVEKSRVSVHREYQGGKYVVTGKGQQQSLSRTSQNLAAIIKSSTALRNSDTIDDQDINLAKKLAIDSIPTKRMNVLRHLINNFPVPLSHTDVLALFHGPRATFDRVLADLKTLDLVLTPPKSADILELVDIHQNEKDLTGKNTISLNPRFFKLLQDADVVKFIGQNY